MKRVRLGRPTPALVISVLALFVALGGTVYAASKISGKTIKPNSIPANRLKKHSLSKTQINLGKLGVVPTAQNAVHATSADSSATTDGIKTWFAKASVGQTVTLLTIGPFTYTGECTAGPHAQKFVTPNQNGSTADSYAAESGYTTSTKNPFNVGDKVSVGYASDEHLSDGVPQWVGPYDGSDTQFSGDGHTYVNTFAAVGTQIQGADCQFIGYAFTRTQ
jgi:hypothetical protein